jgi:L-fuconolactonase
MYGGDWPMTVAHGGYAAAFAVTQELLSELSTHEQTAVWNGTATRTYGRSVHE